MKRRNKVLSLLLAVLLAFPAAPAAAAFSDGGALTAVEAAAKKAEITNVTTDALTIEKGETFQLKANRSDVKWKSSSEAVTVSKTGKLKGIKKGTAKITLSAGGTKDTITVTVGTKVSDVNVIKSSVALLTGGKSTIKADVSPKNASNPDVIYKSADSKVAAVSKDGVVTAKKAGKTKITVLAADGSKKKETVTVTVRSADSPVRLEDDFYQFVNTAVIKEHPLRPDQNMWSNFNDLQDTVTKNLSVLIDELAAKKDSYEKGTIQQKIIDIYLLARDMDTRNQAGIQPLQPYISQIDQAQTVDEFVNVLAQLQLIGVTSILNFSVVQDTLDSNKYALTDVGPSYFLPKDYYGQGDANKAAQQAMSALIKQMYLLAGESEQNALEKAEKVYKLMQEFAESGLGLQDRYNTQLMYNPYSKEDFKKLYSNCDIEGYLKTLGITDFDTCVVREVENAKKVNSYLTPEHLDLLKEYAKLNLYTSYSSYLTGAHYQALQDFNAALAGTVEEKTSDTVAKELTQALFAWEFGKLYTDKYFSEESKQEVEAMTKTLIETFRGRLSKITWLSEETKKKAAKKLDTMTIKIGYPDQWPSYLDEIPVETSLSLAENIAHIQKALTKDVQKMLDSGVDKTKWGITPQTVNAMYNPQANDITFPAAILQAPFYDKNASYAENLGGIGSVIGHEITHAFDNFGSGYDENGNFSNWWTEKDLAEFTARAQKVKDYYSSIEVANGIFQNGDTTVGENIADMGAMACVLDIVGDDKEAQKKVFESNANIWASSQTDQYRDYLLTLDTHSLNKVRVNAVLPLFEQFYEVYGITKDDAMYVAPKDRVQIW